jgi:hypothetical protein
MTRAQYADITKSQQRAIDAFDVEIQTMLVRLRNLAPGATLDVYMTPLRVLYSRQHLGAKLVGTYNARVPRTDFWDDCHALTLEHGWDIRPACQPA